MIHEHHSKANAVGLPSETFSFYLHRKATATGSHPRVKLSGEGGNMRAEEPDTRWGRVRGVGVGGDPRYRPAAAGNVSTSPPSSTMSLMSQLLS